MRIVVISPHQDDAAFSLGLSIEHWIQAGHRVEVLNCFTQSEYAPFSDVHTLHTNDRRSFVSAVRRREDEAWNKQLGRKLKVTNLDLLDAPLRLNCDLGEVQHLEMRPGDRALARVAGALRKIATKGEAAGVALLVPLAVGGHIDHRITRQAAVEALAETAVPLAFYEDLPYAARPGAIDEIEPLAAALDAFQLRPAFTQSPAENVAQSADRKHRFAECYDSQVDDAEAWQIANFCEHYAGRERLWVNTAWPDGLLDPPQP